MADQIDPLVVLDEPGAETVSRLLEEEPGPNEPMCELFTVTDVHGNRSPEIESFLNDQLKTRAVAAKTRHRGWNYGVLEITERQKIEQPESVENRYVRDGMSITDWRAAHNLAGGCADPSELWIWIQNEKTVVQAVATAQLTPAMAVAFGEWLIRWGKG